MFLRRYPGMASGCMAGWDWVGFRVVEVSRGFRV